MQYGKKNFVQRQTDHTTKDTSNLPKRAGSAMLRKFWETTQHTVSHDVEQEKRRENTVVRKSLEWKVPSNMESLEKEDKVREAIFEPKPRLSRTSTGRIQKPVYEGLQRNIQRSSSNMPRTQRDLSNCSPPKPELKRQGAYLWSDHQELESQLGLEENIQMPFGSQVQQELGGMDIKEKTLSSSMNSKDGFNTQQSPKSLETHTHSKLKLKEEQSNLLQRKLSSYPTGVQENGMIPKKPTFVLSKEDFQKYYTLVPVQENEMENGSMKSKDTITSQPLKEIIPIPDMDEDEEIRILEEIEKEIERERDEELKDILKNLLNK